MNYGDHNLIEIIQKIKLRVEPVELDFVKRVDRLARSSRLNVERVESIRVESSQVEFGLIPVVVMKILFPELCD